MRLRETNGCFSKAIAMPMEPYTSKEIKQAWKQPQILFASSGSIFLAFM